MSQKIELFNIIYNLRLEDEIDGLVARIVKIKTSSKFEAKP
jgi:hypothetical protein